MPDGSPFEAELCDVREGDLYVRKMGMGRWTNPAHATRDHDSSERGTVVILERRAPWPDSMLIRIISGWDHNERIAEGTLALRDTQGTYHTSNGWHLSENPAVIIDQWENLPLVDAAALGKILAALPNSDDTGIPDYEYSVSKLWDALNRVMDE
jgi:hypothetical protein